MPTKTEEDQAFEDRVNELKDEIRLVILNNKKSEPVLLPVGRKQAISFSFWNFSNKMEIYR